MVPGSESDEIVKEGRTGGVSEGVLQRILINLFFPYGAYMYMYKFLLLDRVRFGYFLKLHKLFIMFKQRVKHSSGQTWANESLTVLYFKLLDLCCHL